MLIKLPVELILRIVHHVPTLGDKVQLLQTCTHLNHILCTHGVCWHHLDFTAYPDMTNSTLLNFLRSVNITLGTNTTTNNPFISRLDLSGCWSLSQDMIVALSKSFTCLDQLFLNGYPLNNAKKTIGFEQQRDHLYQVRPSHDLSSMAMDLSKKTTQRLNVPYILLSRILFEIPHITSLSVQYQDLSYIHAQRPYFSEFNHIQQLDISSCIISQGALQTLLRKMGRQLASLKMLNIDLNNLTWLSLSQHCKMLHRLHVSCTEPDLLNCVRYTISNLHLLNDFRLTRLRTGSIDLVIEKLNPLLLQVLDISPKMNIYPRSIPLEKRRASLSKKHPPEPIVSMANYATTEHDLVLSHHSILHLARCHALTDLRLCFPTITSPWLHELFLALPQLKCFELRLKPSKHDYLHGIGHLKKLKKLELYSCYLSQTTIDTLAQLPMSHMTLVRGGDLLEKVENQSLLLTQCKQLQVFKLGHLGKKITRKHQWHVPVQNTILEPCHHVVFTKRSHTWSVE